MNSREKILDAIRRVELNDADLPDLNQTWTTYNDRRQQFLKMLEAVGGQGMICRQSEIAERLGEIQPFRQAKEICSLLPEIDGNVHLDQVDDPHELETVDFAVAAGEFAVAENGAIWLTDAKIRHRVIPFLTQHLALVVSAHEIVNNMHEAYARLAFSQRQFGVFISGPSKTADIEQSLVIGAHGARSLTVLLVE